MLQIFHDHFKGWIAGLIIALIALSFLIGSILYYDQPGGSTQGIIATVNGRNVTLKEVQNLAQRFQQDYTAQTGKNFTPDEMQQVGQGALQNLIIKYMLLDAAQQSGFHISANQTIDFIRSSKEFQKDGEFSQDLYQQRLAQYQLTSAQFVSQTSGDLLISQIKNGFTQSAVALPNEIKATYAWRNQTRDFDYLIVPSDHFLSSAMASIDEKKIAAYYQNHLSDFKKPEEVRISYIQLPPQLAEKQRDQLANIAYANPTSLQAVADAFHVKTQTSDLFNQEGTKTGLTANPAIISAAFSAEVLQNNNNSEVIPLPDGSAVVLRIKEHKPTGTKPLSTVSASIKKTLATASAQTESALLAGQLETKIQKGKTWASIQKEYPFLIQKQAKQILRSDSSLNPAIREAAFTLTLSTHPTTTVVLDNNDTALIHLTGSQLGDYSKASTADKNKLADDLKTAEGFLLFQLYAKGVSQGTKIKYMKAS